ncbi:hypothetical protein PIB30_051430 [Stylosanthes scabra]|uniref:Uncharacterized protein n=1 Tax=Stylosanthes scabra TaxID=79078 RepID=A0ABU6ZGN0_9FABA|nr:hypothetical protein [Stylosanthes scabra]
MVTVTAEREEEHTVPEIEYDNVIRHRERRETRHFREKSEKSLSVAKQQRISRLEAFSWSPWGEAPPLFAHGIRPVPIPAGRGKLPSLSPFEFEHLFLSLNSTKSLFGPQQPPNHHQGRRYFSRITFSIYIQTHVLCLLTETLVATTHSTVTASI